MLDSSCSRLTIGLAALGGAWLLSGTAWAHFVLSSPPAMTEQNALGDPQKAPPCGDDGTAVASGAITAYQAGQTITVTIDETIFHPGHYRIALAVNDPSELPEEPPVTPAATPCGSAPIDPAPVFPVLADGVFEHTEPFAESQSIDITLPDDVTCEACTLQIIQFMSNHALNNPGGCYYHHCATISIDSDPVPGTTTDPGDGTGDSGDGDTSAGPGGDTAGPGETNGGEGPDPDDGDPGTTSAAATDGAPVDMDEDTGGCGCTAQRDEPGRLGFGVLALLIGLLGLRRRRREAAAEAAE